MTEIRQQLALLVRVLVVTHIGFAFQEASNQVWLYASRGPVNRQEVEAELLAHCLLIGNLWVLHDDMDEDVETAFRYGVPVRKIRPGPGGKL